MSDGIQVNNVATLERFEQALARFVSRGQQILAEADAEVKSRLNRLNWQVEELSRRDRQATGPDPHDRQREMHSRRARHTAQEAVRMYRTRRSRFQEILERDSEGSIRFLRDAHKLLLAFQAATLGDEGPRASTAWSSGSPRGAAGVGHAWEDSGIRQVRLADLPVVDPGAFEKVTMEEMRTGLETLQSMLPEIESGQGSTSGYWADRDRQAGLSTPEGRERIFDAFFGDSAIRLEKDGDTYDIVNGRHRIWLARQMGLQSLPARVVERQP
ncbi:MAG: hypothetical protein AB1758_00990 [Candidatus Eremiobacterota bacterium]